MARIRTIKPDFFTSEDIVSLSPLARLLFIATWLEADREGRFVWRPKTLKLRYLPGDQCDIDDLAAELVDAGLVVPYVINGQTFSEIPSFTKHQVINNRESASTHPARVTDASATRGQCVTDATTTPLAGKEGKGKEGKARRERATTVPTDFSVSDGMREWALSKGFPAESQGDETERFLDWHRSKGSLFSDWTAAWRNWIAKAVKYRKQEPSGANDRGSLFEGAL